MYAKLSLLTRQKRAADAAAIILPKSRDYSACGMHQKSPITIHPHSSPLQQTETETDKNVVSFNDASMDY